MTSLFPKLNESLWHFYKFNLPRLPNVIFDLRDLNNPGLKLYSFSVRTVSQVSLRIIWSIRRWGIVNVVTSLADFRLLLQRFAAVNEKCTFSWLSGCARADLIWKLLGYWSETWPTTCILRKIFVCGLCGSSAVCAVTYRSTKCNKGWS